MNIDRRSSPIPAYVRMADSLRERIERGVWVADEPLPTLEQLAAEFDVARVTARQAVQLLTGEGLLSPIRGKGTFVTAQGRPRRAVTLQTSLADLSRMYETTTPEILTIREGTAVPPLPSDTRLGDSYVFMRRLHSTEGQPYSVIELYLLGSLFAQAPEEFRTKAVIPTLLRLSKPKLKNAHQTMTIGTVSAGDAHLLRVSAGSPIANVERIFLDRKGLVLYYANVVYRGDWVRWEIDLMT